MGAVTQLLIAYASLRHHLSRTISLPFKGIPERITPGLIRISFGLLLFFVIYSMDIFSAKLFLDQASGEIYARLEFLGRIFFTVVATASFAFFIRIVRAYDDSRLHLPKVKLWLLALVSFLAVGAAASLPYLYDALFDAAIDDHMEAMLMVVIAKVIQSFLFVVVTIKGATVSRFVLRWLGLVVAVQCLLFIISHDSIGAIAQNILVSGLFAAVLFAASLFLERNGKAVR